MTSKTELKKMIEALREEVRELRLDIANLQTMVRNQDKSTITNIPFTPTPNGTGPYFPSDFSITCTADTSQNADDEIVTAVN